MPHLHHILVQSLSYLHLVPCQHEVKFLLLNQTCSHFYPVGIIDQSVNFQLTTFLDSIDISFSLICNSTGGTVTSLIWTRDGFPLDNTDPLVLTDAPTASYTNVLQVNSGTTGEYTCLIRGPNDELLNSTTFNVQGSSYPRF